jgi:hypothetical protein
MDRTKECYAALTGIVVQENRLGKNVNMSAVLSHVLCKLTGQSHTKVERK